jgi:hypothetical protein
MQTYITDLIPRIQRFSQKLDNLTLLTNQHWVVIDEMDRCKNVYIFRASNELLISSNGEVKVGVPGQQYPTNRQKGKELPL